MSNVGIEADTFDFTSEGRRVDRFTLHNTNGLMVRLINFGATVTELHVPDRDGRTDDVVLGFDRLADYQTKSPYFGCIVGRVAFRITEGRFRLGEESHQLTLNNGRHHLHGGVKGLSWVVWDAEPLSTADGPAVEFNYSSPHLDQGYPGNLHTSVVYTLTNRNELRIDYRATTDRPTPVNLTHHGYFNLAGSGDVLGHVVQLEADRYCLTDEAIIPTGELAPVRNTPFDFTRPTAINARLDQVGGLDGGYDLAYLRGGQPCSPTRVATVHEPGSGRLMEVDSTAPAVVFYTGNYLDGSLRGKKNAVYGRHAGFCIEPGHLPDAVHHPEFPSVVLQPEQTYQQTSVYRFSTK